jgi:hypothetical protein
MLKGVQRKEYTEQKAPAHEQRYRKLNTPEDRLFKAVFAFRQSCSDLVAKNIKQRHASSFLVFT